MRFYFAGIRMLFVIFLSMILCGCGFLAPNRAYHEDIEDAMSFNANEQYDFGFIEFSEHGNLFNRQIYDQFLKEIERVQATQPTALVVFVHGWHHNAHSSDEDVVGFKELLSKMAARDDGPFKGHRVIGAYIGWRGASFPVPGLQYLTFWDRKAVASEVGRGGVTEALLTLERVSRCGSRDKECDEAENKKNRILILGHSFGGAIVLSALSDVFVERLINAKILAEKVCEDEPGDIDGTFSQKRGAPCVRTNPFGHGVVLLNPAIDANQILPLKEIMSSFRYPDSQDVLMHVLSSEGDWANRFGFSFGQWIQNLTWSEVSFPRLYNYPREKPVELSHDEASLTETTIGNYAPFRTAWLGGNGGFARCSDRRTRKDCQHGDESPRVPIGTNEPIQIIFTDKYFIEGHGDIFNCLVRSYVLVIAEEAVYTSTEGEMFPFKKHYDSLRKHCSH